MSSYKYKKIKLPDGSTRDEHRLVLEDYLGRRLEKYEVVHHINGNSKDNRIENLEICLLSEHSRCHMPKGRKLSKETVEKIKENHSRCRILGSQLKSSKLTEMDIPIIRKRIHAQEKISTIAKDYNVSTTTIYYIKNERLWIHV